MAKNKTTLQELKPNEANPRKPFTPEQLVAFAKSLAEFGDLSGIVFNQKTGRLVGGHKRVEQFKKDDSAEVVIEHVLDKPDKAGTLSWGWVNTGGTRFSYRVVAWPRKKEAAANIAANQHGAEFEWEAVATALKQIEDLELLALTGLPDYEISNLLAASWSAPAVEAMPDIAAPGMVVMKLTENAHALFCDVKKAMKCDDDSAAITKLCERYATSVPPARRKNTQSDPERG